MVDEPGCYCSRAELKAVSNLGSLVFSIIYLLPLLEEPQPTISTLSCHFHIRICDKPDSFLFPLCVCVDMQMCIKYILTDE